VGAHLCICDQVLHEFVPIDRATMATYGAEPVDLDDEDYDASCQICMENFPDVSMSPCGHTLCEKCCVLEITRTNKVQTALRVGAICCTSFEPRLCSISSLT